MGPFFLAAELDHFLIGGFLQIKSCVGCLKGPYKQPCLQATYSYNYLHIPKNKHKNTNAVL